ncbi:MAG: T9SS type A sorting domain-containing protein [Ignavibacteriales bacterium]|nr:T9SS type A sorting domain-containing protein [Ignavibacteriales bacterium]
MISSLKNNDGSFANSFTIGTGKNNGATLVESQSAVIRGLYAAYEATGNTTYLTEANNAYDYLISNFYSPEKKAFYTTLGSTQAIYTPYNVAIISGALREARLVGNKNESPLIYTRFFNQVGNVMQLSESENSGESGNDSDGDGIPYLPEQVDNLPSIFAAEAVLSLITDVEDNNIVTPASFNLAQNFPNPFNPSTIISFDIPADAFVKLKVYNILGQEVAQLVNETKTAGKYQVNWNGTDNAGNKVTSGVYLYRLKANDFTSTRKMILTK